LGVKQRRWIVGVLFVLALLAAGCGPSYPEVHLYQLAPLPADAPVEVMPLRVAIAAVISPKGTAESYRPLLSYLQEKLGRPVELVQRRTYAEINDLVKSGYVDVAFVCTSAYVAGHRDFGMSLLAAPQTQGKTVYYSVLIVPAGSSARSLADLRGRVFAFTDPMSTSGRLYPTFLVNQLGEAPESFFSRTFFTYSHDDAIRAVANGLADGAAVDSLVYDYAIAREPGLATRTRIIHRSPPFGIPPVVVGPSARPQLIAELRDALLNMADEPEGQAALAQLDIERFVLIEDSAYDSVRELERQVGPLPLPAERSVVP